ncbi:iron-containing alcohol dehydrogenase [Xenorhabdus siamensis]|uniref:iron-containing alcohol dehydrogenase n=1 Tax=Xenorhabdus siamensis TaxID=3136254 RepID=UPI0030F39CEA
MKEKNINVSLSIPTKIIIKNGAIEDVTSYLEQYELKKTLVIITEGMLSRSLKVKNFLSEKNHRIKIIPYILNSNFKASVSELKKVKEIIYNNELDSIISIGGGNVIDFGKVAAICIDKTISLDSIVGKTIEKVEKKLFHISIPTTFGTGSEVTKGAIIYDDFNGLKDGVRGASIFPDLAIIDPNIGKTLPDNILRETIFDSFSHAFESIQSVNNNRFIDLISYESLFTLDLTLDKYSMGIFDDDFYNNIAYIALLGGICVYHNSTCLPHRFEQALSPIYSLSHGAGLSALYPAWIKQLESHNAFTALPEYVIKGKSLYEYVMDIIEKLNLTHTPNQLKSLNISSDFISNKITGKIENDPLIKKEGNHIIQFLSRKYLGE